MVSSTPWYQRPHCIAKGKSRASQKIGRKRTNTPKWLKSQDILRASAPVAIRSDADIARTALNALEGMPGPQDSTKLTVTGRWIMLDVEVEFYYRRTAAEFAVRNLVGVTGVTDLIALRRPTISASEVKTKIEGALQRGAETDAKRVRVDVESQKVTLSGTVNWSAEHQEAQRAAWSAQGVDKVVDDLVIAS